jgi:ADP-ribose pyrophosphatase
MAEWFKAPLLKSGNPVYPGSRVRIPFSPPQYSKSMKKIQKWKRLSQEKVFEKYGKKINKVVFELPNGKRADYYLKDEGDVAGVLAITKNGKIVFAEQYRPGPDKILLGLPGGFLDPGEKPEVAAARELLEETGYKGNLELVGCTIHDAYSNRKKYVFVGKNCVKCRNARPEEGEIINVRLVSMDQLRKWVQKGQIMDADLVYLALDYLGLLK